MSRAAVFPAAGHQPDSPRFAGRQAQVRPAGRTTICPGSTAQLTGEVDELAGDLLPRGLVTHVIVDPFPSGLRFAGQFCDPPLHFVAGKGA